MMTKTQIEEISTGLDVNKVKTVKASPAVVAAKREKKEVRNRMCMCEGRRVVFVAK